MTANVDLGFLASFNHYINPDSTKLELFTKNFSAKILTESQSASQQQNASQVCQVISHEHGL